MHLAHSSRYCGEKGARSFFFYETSYRAIIRSDNAAHSMLMCVFYSNQATGDDSSRAEREREKLGPGMSVPVSACVSVRSVDARHH